MVHLSRRADWICSKKVFILHLNFLLWFLHVSRQQAILMSHGLSRWSSICQATCSASKLPWEKNSECKGSGPVTCVHVTFTQTSLWILQIQNVSLQTTILNKQNAILNSSGPFYKAGAKEHNRKTIICNTIEKEIIFRKFCQNPLKKFLGIAPN